MNTLVIGESELTGILIYLISVSVLSLIVTVYDKIASLKLPQHRIRELTLFLLALFGGGAVMFVTMYVIRHKTAHGRFMLGLPIIVLLQLAAVWGLLHFDVVILNIA